MIASMRWPPPRSSATRVRCGCDLRECLSSTRSPSGAASNASRSLAGDEGEVRARPLLDAYCGSGLFALASAGRFEACVVVGGHQ